MSEEKQNQTENKIELVTLGKGDGELPGVAQMGLGWFVFVFQNPELLLFLDVVGFFLKANC